MSKSSKNFTFSLPIDLLDKLKDFSKEGYISSVNAAVKEAIESYVIKLEKQNLYLTMKEAAKDPMFIKDLDDAISDFTYSDFEAMKENDE